MVHFFQRLFSGTAKSKGPKVTWAHRLEGIEYADADNTVHIVADYYGGIKIYIDTIKTWREGTLISTADKAIIFRHIVGFASRKGKRKVKPIIVINIDYDKEFWEALCQEKPDWIREIKYNSNKEREDFVFNHYLGSVRNGGTIIFGDVAVKTEREFMEYWISRKTE